MNSVWKIVGSLLIVYIIGLVLFLPATNAASNARVALEEGEEQDVFVSEPVAPGVSQAVRDLQAPERDPVLDREINPRKNPDFLDGVGENIVGPVDALREASSRNSGRTPSPILNFEGQGINGATPPDMVGDVGPTHYVQMVNVTFAMYDKSGNQVQAPRQINQLWEGSSGQSVCEQQNAGDPIVLHDQLADRWLLSQFALPNHICVAISQSADPTGAYYTYQFDVGAFPDYFKFGVWPDGYYMTANEGGSNAYTAYAFDRSNMLAGQAATFQKVTGQTNLMLPSDLDGATPPPADSPNYFYTFKDNNRHGVASDQLEVRAFDVDWTTPTNSSFTLVATIPITSFTYSVCGHFDFDCVPQAGTSQKVDSVSEWPMWRAPYRNFGTHEALVGNFAVDVGSDQAGIRWFELRKSGSGAWALHQEGTHAPDSHHRWMGSMAMDQSGNIGLGYSVSSSTLNPQIRYTTRLSSDAAGTLGAEETLIAGSGSQTSINRWGDYSSLNVDPSDDCTFWYTNQYLSASGGSWQTRIGTFKIPSCGSGTSLTPTPSSPPLSPTPTAILSATPTPISTPSTSDPQIEVDPSQLSSTQPAGAQASKTLSIRNTGAQDLTWTIQEDQQRGDASIESTDEPSEQMSPEEQIAKREALQQAFLADRQPAQDLDAMAATPCVGGMAGSYPCNNVDLLAFMPLADIGGGEGNDIWGWTDPETGKEYAIMGRTSGTAFVDISNPENPVYLGNLPRHTSNSSWRDIKVYNNHAFIVSEASGHGMQVFDLTELATVTSPPVTFSNTAHYSGFGNAHNIVINEESGFAYAVGTGTCSSGLHMVDITTPTSPTNAGCFSSDGYTHDAQCVMYNGPDTTHQGQEICFNSNEDTLTIVDVSNKNSPAQLSRTGYAGRGYTHQGWLTEDHSYFLLDDETDEQSSGHNTRTRIWDVSDLDAPVLLDIYDGTTSAIDHNLYIKGSHVYESNYRAGLRILDASDVANGNLSEVAYFDIYPSSDSPSFNGSWSNYPYFESGVVIVSGIEQGLFIVRPNLDGSPPPPPPEACDTPSDIPWASVSPTSGSTPASGNSTVSVTFDSTGLTTGTYTGTLCINSNDPATSLVPVPLTLAVMDSSQTINLNQGWNKIGLSVEPTSPIMAESLCAEMGNIVEINRWHAGGWDGHICGESFNNFTIETNNGYFVQSDAVATWDLEGLPINSPTLDLQIGWNSISLPHTDGYTAESLCEEIIDQGVTAVEINRWYAGGWDGHICGLTFNDFAINRGQGYFIKSTSAGPVTPPALAVPPIQPPSEGLPQVGPAMPIRDLVVSNLRDTSLTLSWTTEEATTGYVRFAGNPSTSSGHRREGLPEGVALDIRGANTSSRTHLVLLDELAPETTYHLEVISGVDGTQTPQITVTTAPTLESVPSSDTIYGQIFELDGAPAAGALVQLTIIDADGAGSSGEATPLAALVDAEGYWHANLGNARTADLSAYFNYSPQGDQLLIKAQGPNGRTATETVDTAHHAPALDITLASAPTAVKVATYDAAPASTPWQAGVLLVTFLLAAAGWSRRKTQAK